MNDLFPPIELRCIEKEHEAQAAEKERLLELFLEIVDSCINTLCIDMLATLR